MRTRGAAVATGLAGFAVAVAARHWVPRSLTVETIEVPLPPGAAGFDRFRIAFLTDTHYGPFVDRAHLREMVAVTAGLGADLVLLGGDYVSESARHADVAAAELGVLAGAPHGALAVLGNHDLAVSPTRVADRLAEAGIRVLRNEAVAIERAGSQLWIVGLDDTLLGHPDPEAAFAGVPAGALAIALWHEPEFAEAAARQGAFLQLSGHTHAGQVSLPGIGPLALPVHGRRHVEGMHDVHGMRLYTSRGAGTYRPPVRLGASPEVTLVVLRGEHPSREAREGTAALG